MEKTSKTAPVCCICHRPIEGYPHNAAPLAEGVCCGKCNVEKVLPYRLALSRKDGQVVLEDWTIEEETGYKPVTTFYTDFSIADKFGLSAIQDTYERSFEEWKTNCRYVTELAMVLNWKCWRWYRVNDEYSKLYTDLFRKLDEWLMNNLKGEELEYYIKTTD